MSAAEIVAVVGNGSLKPEAVVIDVDLNRSAELAAALEDAGAVTARAQTGAEGFGKAVGQMNCDLILLHSNCIRWELSTTIANLRADARTRRTPIIIYGPDYSKRSALRLAGRYDGIWFISEPVGGLSLLSRMQYMNVAAPLLSEAERGEMRELASKLYQELK